jgi:hypothetical protein
VDGHSNQTVALANISSVAIGYTGNAASYPGTYGACTTNICHQDSSGGNITWGNSPTSCSQCHQSLTKVNNFNGKDKAASMVTAADYTGMGHGKTSAPAMNKACTDCHAVSAGHDLTTNLGGANPYRLTGTFTCTNTTSCHSGAVSKLVRSHTTADLSASGYTPRYTWSFQPACMNCHDPHGDGNAKMVQKALYDKAAFTLPAGPAPAFPTEQTNLVFTDLTSGQSASGTSFARSQSPFDSICQECHEGTPGVDTTKGYVDNASANYSGHPGYVSSTADNPTDCSACHKHNEGFKPSGCASCHDGSKALAPNVMTYWSGSDSGSKDGGHGDPQRLAVLKCEACHNTSVATHGDGILQSAEQRLNRNSNTVHLNSSFIGTASPAYSVQVAFDNACWNCHSTYGMLNMRHENDSLPAANVVQFGTHLSVTDGASIPTGYPIDYDLSTLAPSGAPHYAPCSACHNPHGTGVPDRDAATGSNYMLRKNYKSTTELCNICHK